MKTKIFSLILTFLFSVTPAFVTTGCGGGGGSDISGPNNPLAGSNPDTTLPETPANLNATAASSSRINLSWDAAADNIGVTGYKIYRNGTYLKSVAEMSANDTQLNAGTQYCYRITAFDASGNESAQGADACATTMSIWSGTKRLGTATYDNALAAAVDELGNVYATGVTYGNLDGNTSAGEYDIILVKHDNSGIKQWTRQLGSSSDDYGNSVAVDGNGNIYIAGYTSDNLDGYVNSGREDIILIKYNAAGLKQWTRQLGSADMDEALGVAADGSGNVYVAGVTSSGLDGNSSAGNNDLFLVKFNSAGQKQWTRQLGSAEDDEAYALTVDISGNAYITGLTAGNLAGNAGSGGQDVFLIKYDATGTQQWTKQFGTASDDYGYGVAVDGAGNIYVAGTTAGSLEGNTHAGGNDIFLAKFTPYGTLQWIRQQGTSTDDLCWGIAVDASANIFVAGSTDGSIDGNSNAGNYDGLLAKYNSAGDKQWTRQIGTEFNDEAYGVAVNADGQVFVSGYTYGDLDGNTNIGENDLFVAKYNPDGVKQ